jgi:hypothetical protein
VALDLPNRKIYLLEKKGGKCVNTHRPGRLGEFVEAFFPVRS